MTILAIIHHVPDITLSARHLVHLVERPAGTIVSFKKARKSLLTQPFSTLDSTVPQFRMAWLPIFRLVTFGRILQPVSRVPLLKTNFAVVTVILFALIVMSISADLIALTEPHGGYFKFSALALATSLITLFTVIPMYAFVPCQVAP